MKKSRTLFFAGPRTDESFDAARGNAAVQGMVETLGLTLLENIQHHQPAPNHTTSDELE